MSDVSRLRTWLVRAAPRRYDLIKALFIATVASLAGTGLFVGALALLVVSSQRPGLRALAVFLIAIELVAFVRSPLRFTERMSTHRLGFAAVSTWRHWLTDAVGGWPYSRWQRHGAGDLLERSLTDTEELQDLWLRSVIPSVASVATLVVSDVVVAALAPRGHWWAVALAGVIAQGVAIALLVARLTPLARADRGLRTVRGRYLAALVSSRAAAPEIEHLGASDFLRQRTSDVTSELRRAEDAVARARQRDAAVVLIGTLAALGGVSVAHPHSAGVWLVVAALVMTSTFDALTSVRTAVQVAVAVIGGAERLDDLASSSPSPTGSWPLDTTLALRDVVVAASRGQRHALDAVIAPGRRVALRGPSGSGKSTLLRALAHLDDVTPGVITVGALSIETIAESELRRHIVLVPSEPGLLRGYVRDVVGLGVTISDDDLENLDSLGIAAQRNDHWEELSRGERQRVALVRALARQPDIVLLDEPTSALGEAETELVLRLLDTVGATIVVATHDPRVVAWCDEVIDLADVDA